MVEAYKKPIYENEPIVMEVTPVEQKRIPFTLEEEIKENFLSFLEISILEKSFPKKNPNFKEWAEKGFKGHFSKIVYELDLKENKLKKVRKSRLRGGKNQRVIIIYILISSHLA